MKYHYQYILIVLLLLYLLIPSYHLGRAFSNDDSDDDDWYEAVDEEADLQKRLDKIRRELSRRGTFPAGDWRREYFQERLAEFQSHLESMQKDEAFERKMGIKLGIGMWDSRVNPSPNNPASSWNLVNPGALHYNVFENLKFRVTKLENDIREEKMRFNYPIEEAAGTGYPGF